MDLFDLIYPYCYVFNCCILELSKNILQICRAIDDYLQANAQPLYTVYAINNEFSESEEEVEVGVEPHQEYEELIPRRRGFGRRIWQTARRGY